MKSASQKPPAPSGSSRSKKAAQKDIYNERNNKPEVPDCDCFSSDKKPPEPGSYYTHLGKETNNEATFLQVQRLICHWKNRLCIDIGRTSQGNWTACRSERKTASDRESFVHWKGRKVESGLSHCQVGHSTRRPRRKSVVHSKATTRASVSVGRWNQLSFA